MYRFLNRSGSLRPFSPSAITVKVLAVAAVSVAALVQSIAPAHADVYLTSGSYTANNSTYASNPFYLGRDSNFSPTDSLGNPYVATLNVVTGGNVFTASAYNTSTINVSGGGLFGTVSYDNSTTNISGGTVNYADNYGSGTTNISGGNVGEIYNNDTGTFNISGGTVGYASGNTSSIFNISGGVLTGPIDLYDTSLLNITGRNLTVSGPTGTGTDGVGINFTSYSVSGQWADTTAFAFTVRDFDDQGYGFGDLSIGNPTLGAANTGNLRFFSSVSAAVPEAGTFALALPALGLIGAVILRRRQK